MRCRRCVNSEDNPTIQFSDRGTCHVCEAYEDWWHPETKKEEQQFFQTLKKDKIGVGISGGKDSTATLYLLLDMGFSPEAFTFDIGYYPEHIFPRAKKTAKHFNVHHETIDIRPYIRSSEIESYKLTADLYDLQNLDFINIYQLNRKEYSVKSTAVMPYVRACQLCRKTVIQAYVGEAKKRGWKAVVLGMNEWAGLANQKFTAIREIQGIYIVHLPFLLDHCLEDTARILHEKCDWEFPKGETWIESNANSCLFAKATESIAKKHLGFHPDSTRLGRELSVGFMKKEWAVRALEQEHHSVLSVREVLEKANII